MFHELRLQNFKGFQDAHRIPLAPITLIFGPNSAGKSAVIKALLLLAQSINSSGRPGSESQSPPLQFSGERVDLANFTNTIYAHEVFRSMGLGVSHTAEDSILSFDIGVSNETKIQLDRVTYELSDNPSKKISFVAAQPESGSSSNYLQIDKNIETYLNVLNDQIYVDSGLKRLTKKKLVKYFAEQKYPRSAFLPYDPFIENRGNGEQIIAAAKERWRSIFKSDSISKDEAMKLRIAEFHWGQQLIRRYVLTTQSLMQISHIGPIRNIFGRYQEIQPGRKSYVGQEGQQTIEVLLQSQVTGISSQTMVNDWLERFGLRYKIRVAEITPDNLPLVGDLASLVISDTRSGVDLSARDVGVGISQVIPVIVQALIAQNRTLLIEQPELHLHPKMQSEVGDLLIHSMRQGGNQLIVETHSEHLLLRLMRRIREGELPNDVLKVIYVDADDDGSQATILDFDNNGRLTNSWPNGFFEERLDELQ